MKKSSDFNQELEVKPQLQNYLAINFLMSTKKDLPNHIFHRSKKYLMKNEFLKIDHQSNSNIKNYKIS